MKTIPLHSNDRTMENLTKGIVPQREVLDCDTFVMDFTTPGEPKIYFEPKIMLCTPINEGILIDRG